MSRRVTGAAAAFPLQTALVDRARGYPRGMSPTDLDEEIREALGDAEEPPEPLPAPARRRWWSSGDWWLRTTASAAVGKLVGAVLTGVGLLLAWLAAKAAGWIS
jgi:hypothetical protein